MQTLSARELPESIDLVDNDIVNKVIICEQTGRPYQITKIELALYRSLGIALPRLHHSVRHTMRIRRRAPREFVLRTCSSTGEETLSVYPPNTNYPVYSWKVFEKLVY